MKIHRRKLGLTQAKLAELVGVSDNHIAMMETCKRFPSLNMMISLAIALQVDVLELFSMEFVNKSAKNNLKTSILQDIDQILTIRLLDEG